MTVSELILELVKMQPDMPIQFVEHESGKEYDLNAPRVYRILDKCKIVFVTDGEEEGGVLCPA